MSRQTHLGLSKRDWQGFRQDMTEVARAEMSERDRQWQLQALQREGQLDPYEAWHFTHQAQEAPQ